jgi:hypothetical protein
MLFQLKIKSLLCECFKWWSWNPRIRIILSMQQSACTSFRAFIRSRRNSTPIPGYFKKKKNWDCTYPINKMIKLTKKPLNFLMKSLQFLIPGKVLGVYCLVWSGCRLLLVFLLPWPERKINESPDHCISIPFKWMLCTAPISWLL